MKKCKLCKNIAVFEIQGLCLDHYQKESIKKAKEDPNKFDEWDHLD